jgi:hypothetical protein
MFDPDLCPRSSSTWTTFTWFMSDLLAGPIPLHLRSLLVTLCFASVIWVIWKLRQPRWQRRFQRLGRLC